MLAEERLRPARRSRRKSPSLNMGTMNFGLFPMLERFKDFKHDWGAALFSKARATGSSATTFADIYEDDPRPPVDGNGTRFEFECYDIGHLYTLAHFLDRGQRQAAALRA